MRRHANRSSWVRFRWWGYVSVLALFLLLMTSCNKHPTTSTNTPASISTNIPTNSQKNTPTNTPNYVGNSNGEALPEYNLQFAEAFGGAIFNVPVGIRHAGDDSGRLFIVEKSGTIVMLSGNLDHPQHDVFLDISDKVYSEGMEQGLLGLTFHPDFNSNGLFYINYTTDKSTIIASYQVDKNNPNHVDATSDRILLEFKQPYSNHNGGELAFGSDGYLYIATGDGGSGGDPDGNGQNLHTLLGKILRIDVNDTSDNLHYSIPHDNPFYNNKLGYRQEIYAYGLRNPWRFSFDSENEMLWAADVGQNKIEEINIIENGHNYGWNTMEGSECFNPRDNCTKSDLTLPIWEYQPQEGGASITGGYVYRGQEIPKLYGKYIFADFMDGRVWVLEYDGLKQAQAEQLKFKQPGITSFGVDESGELYACLYDGKIVRLMAK